MTFTESRLVKKLATWDIQNVSAGCWLGLDFFVESY